MADFNCPHCEDTGFITVRTTYPMSYVCAGSPPEDARGVCEARCPNCDPVMLAAEYDDE
jgi:hypothetical protein